MNGAQSTDPSASRTHAMPAIASGLLIAVALALVGEISLWALAMLAHPYAALSISLTVLGGAYGAYLIATNRRDGLPTGSLTLAFGWLVASGAALVLAPATSGAALLWVLAVQCSSIWLVRCWCFVRRPLGALLDLGVIAAGMAFAAWSWQRTGSVALTIWCFFLIQAVFVWNPWRAAARSQTGSTMTPDPGAAPFAFDVAHRRARSALESLLRHP